MARSGHLSSQSLHAMQSSGLAANAFSSESSSSTFFGQKCTQIPHPLHQFLFIRCSFSLGFFPMCRFLVSDKKGFKDSRVPGFKEFSIAPLEPFYFLFTFLYKSLHKFINNFINVIRCYTETCACLFSILKPYSILHIR